MYSISETSFISSHFVHKLLCSWAIDVRILVNEQQRTFQGDRTTQIHSNSFIHFLVLIKYNIVHVHLISLRFTDILRSISLWSTIPSDQLKLKWIWSNFLGGKKGSVFFLTSLKWPESDDSYGNGSQSFNIFYFDFWRSSVGIQRVM